MKPYHVLPARQRQVLYYLLPPQKPIWRAAVTRIHQAEKPLGKRLYYLHVEDRLAEGHWNRFDPQGVPVRGTRVKPLYNYTTVCAYALAHWNLYLSGRPDSLLRFLSISDWLVQQQAQDGAWYYMYDFDNPPIRAPWPSAMAQGEALSVLARAYALTGNEAYKKAGTNALGLFMGDTSAGGVRSLMNQRYPFYEEVPSQPASHILNGFLYSLFGLYDWQSITCQPARELWRAGFETLKNTLTNYDAGYWSYTDLYPGVAHVASFAYHDLHLAQLNVFKSVWTDSEISEVVARWQKYRQSIGCRVRAAVAKLYYSIQT